MPSGPVLSTDQIIDFATGDKIDLSLIDADTGIAGNQTFVLDTDSVIAAGEINISATTATSVTLNIYVDADAVADMTIVVLTTGLVASDFIL